MFPDLVSLMTGGGGYDAISNRASAEQARAEAEVARIRESVGHVGGIDTNSAIPLPPDLPPLVRAISALTGNVASAVSGNPFYQQSNERSIAAQDEERRAAIRARAEAALGEAKDLRAIHLRTSLDDLAAQREAAQRAGATQIDADLRAQQERVTKELQKSSETAAMDRVNAEHTNRLGEIQASGQQALNLERERNANPPPVTGNKNVDALIRMWQGDNVFRTVAENEYEAALKAKTTKAKSVDAYIASSPSLQTKQAQMRAAITPQIAHPYEGEKADAWLLRVNSSGLTPEEIQTYGKLHFPNDNFTHKGTSATAAKGKRTRQTAFQRDVSPLLDYGKFGPSIAFPIGGLPQPAGSETLTPSDIANSIYQYFNFVPPDSSR